MSPTVQPATAQDDFWLDEPASIARVLRELARTRTPLLFEPAGIPTRLLLADEDRRACVLEWCRNGRELERLLNATGLSLRGSLGGTPIRFAAGTPEVTRPGNTPAFHIACAPAVPAGAQAFPRPPGGGARLPLPAGR